MSDDPLAPSTDSDIPTPTRDDLLPHVHGSVRDQLRAGILDARHAANEWAGARRTWDEEHKKAAEQRRAGGETKQQFPGSAGFEETPPPEIAFEEHLEQEKAATKFLGNTEPEKPPPLNTADRPTALSEHSRNLGEEHEAADIALEPNPIINPTSQSTLRAICSFLRRFAAIGGGVLLGACWTMLQIDEYALAFLLLLVGLVAISMQVGDWKGIENHSKATRIVKGAAGLLVLCSFVYFSAVIIKRENGKAWSNLLPNEPLASPTPTPLQNPSPAPSVQQLASPEPPSTIAEDAQHPISDTIGIPMRVGGRTLYPKMQLEYNERTQVFLLAVYVDSTDLTAEVCIRLLQYYPRLKVTMVKNVEESSEAWQDLKIKGLLIVHKSSLTNEQIKELKRHARKLKIDLILKGPSLS